MCLNIHLSFPYKTLFEGLLSYQEFFRNFSEKLLEFLRNWELCNDNYKDTLRFVRNFKNSPQFSILPLPTIKSIFYSNESNITISYPEAVTQRCSMKKVFLQNLQNWQENTCVKFSFFNKVAGLWPLACNFIKKETLAQMFSCKFCKICKNSFFSRTSLVAVSLPEYIPKIYNPQNINIPKYKYPQNI